MNVCTLSILALCYFTVCSSFYATAAAASAIALLLMVKLVKEKKTIVFCVVACVYLMVYREVHELK